MSKFSPFENFISNQGSYGDGIFHLIKSCGCPACHETTFNSIVDWFKETYPDEFKDTLETSTSTIKLNFKKTINRELEQSSYEFVQYLRDDRETAKKIAIDINYLLKSFCDIFLPDYKTLGLRQVHMPVQLSFSRTHHSQALHFRHLSEKVLNQHRFFGSLFPTNNELQIARKVGMSEQAIESKPWDEIKDQVKIMEQINEDREAERREKQWAQQRKIKESRDQARIEFIHQYKKMSPKEKIKAMLEDLPFPISAIPENLLPIKHVSNLELSLHEISNLINKLQNIEGIPRKKRILKAFCKELEVLRDTKKAKNSESFLQRIRNYLNF